MFDKPRKIFNTEYPDMKIFIKLFHRDIRSNKSNDYFFLYTMMHMRARTMERSRKLRRWMGYFYAKEISVIPTWDEA